MQARVVQRPGPVRTGPLRRVTPPVPDPGPGKVRLRVLACGVCRTDLHLAEGDLTPMRPRAVACHEIGRATGQFAVGDRVGVAWLRGTCGRCRWCRSGRD